MMLERTLARRSRAAVAAIVIAGSAGLAGCTLNPATGEESFTAFMSPADEIETGRGEHPKVLREFGGAYDDPQLAAYVDSLGQFLARTSELPDLEWTFTVLDSDVTNAFALPGGYVYVTRGLVALADSEAQLAAVLGHEIGHVAARHTAQRYSQTVIAQLGAAALGIFAGQELGNLAGQVAPLYLASYSRDQEFEADVLGVRYSGRAGFDTLGMAGFLEKLQMESELTARLQRRDKPAEFSYLSTHPQTPDRVRQAIGQAGPRVPGRDDEGRDVFFSRIDGLIYGDDPKDGFIRGRRFAHPALDVQFEVPPDFTLFNSTTRVFAIGPQQSRIVFDRAPQGAQGPMRAYLEQVWAKNVPLADVETITVNGVEAATGRVAVDTREGRFDLRIVAYRWDPQTVYRFQLITPQPLTDRLGTDLRRTTYSLRRLGAAERAALKPYRIRIHTVRAGDTVESLAAGLPFDELKVDRFRVLNGLKPGEALAPGRKLKLVVE